MILYILHCRVLKTSSNDDSIRAILRDVTADGKSKQFIEIWNNNHIIKSYDLSAFDVHGDVYSERNELLYINFNFEIF